MIAPVESSTVFKLLLSLPEAADTLSVCERTVTRLIQRGELRAIKVGPRGVRVAVSDLQSWIAKQANGVAQ